MSLCPNRGCSNTFCCLILGLLAVLHVFLPLLPFFTATFRVRGTRSTNEILEFFFPSSYKFRKEKQVKLLKIDFRKSGKRTHFSSVRPACTSVVLLEQREKKRGERTCGVFFIEALSAFPNSTQTPWLGDGLYVRRP